MKNWGFCGGSYRGYSPQSLPARTINLFVETVAQQNSKATKRLVNVPGKRRFGTLTDRPGRGIFFGDGRCFAVGGGTLFQVHANGTVTSLGTVAQGGPAVITSNGNRGNQVLVAAGGNGYIWNTSTSAFAQITDAQFPPSGVITCGYLDGYFIVVTFDRFQISALLDGLNWGADVGQRVGAPENLTGALIDHEVLWLAGATQTEVWADFGTANFPFEPIPGVFLEHGLEAAHAICRLGDSIAWLASDERGGRQVMRNQGYNAIPISHEGISALLSGLPSVADARMWSYQIHGHTFAVLTIPSQRLTLQYDAKEQEWTESLHFNTTTGQFEADRSVAHAFAFGKHLTLDRETGDIWELSMDVHVDGVDAEGNDRPLRWMRIAPVINDENRMLFFHEAELDASMGVSIAGTGQGSDAEVMLRFSDDAGKTFGSELRAKLGKLGVYDNRARWHMLGSSRNRVFEVSGSDPVETVLNDLLLNVSRGTH